MLNTWHNAATQWRMNNPGSPGVGWPGDVGDLAVPSAFAPYIDISSTRSLGNSPYRASWDWNNYANAAVGSAGPHFRVYGGTLNTTEMQAIDAIIDDGVGTTGRMRYDGGSQLALIYDDM